ncbi:amidohydrolase family protein [Amycolatopsis sp. TNS106]|uniref:amidohydrolase family protein n=1 Tax=Amycolatopsis sp. TNS106 TaxID=2861750 RepID=UPI001C5614DF|nr:amidohydrolase family protein [Amycolatopsis sp. TNS106]
MGLCHPNGGTGRADRAHTAAAMKRLGVADALVDASHRAGIDADPGLIADPSHLAPEAIQPAFRAAAGRIVLVTDGVTRRADSTPAGTTITLLDAVRHACDIGITTEAAVNAATRTPARLYPGAGIGLLRPGDRADVLVLDEAMRLRSIFHRGRPVEPRAPSSSRMKERGRFS